MGPRCRNSELGLSAVLAGQQLLQSSTPLAITEHPAWHVLHVHALVDMMLVGPALNHRATEQGGRLRKMDADNHKVEAATPP